MPETTGSGGAGFTSNPGALTFPGGSSNTDAALARARDPELAALTACVNALVNLGDDGEAVQRVLRYLRERFEVED